MRNPRGALRLLTLCLASIFAAECSAADMDDEEANALYSKYKSEITLEGTISDPYYSEMQVLDDKEHGWNDPARLVFFDEILKVKGRTDKSDREILAPWLIRYLWVTECPNYTQGAWRLLRRLDLDETFMQIAALDVLANHPHGLARAAVIEGTEDYQPWLEDPKLLALAERLAFEDSHPDVRLGALDYVGSVSAAKIESALETDPSAHVRAALARLFKSKETDTEKTEQALREALFSPKNASVAPQMMRTYLSSGTVKADFQRLSQGLNWLAENSEHPLSSTIRDQFGWQMDEEALPLFLTGVPYADGAALRLWLRAVFADENRPLLDRSRALNRLASARSETLAPQEIADFLFDPRHETASLAPLFDFGGSRAARRLLEDRPEITVSQAATRSGLALKFLEFLSEPGPDGKMRGSGPIHSSMLSAATRRIGSSSAAASADPLFERLLTHAQSLPVDAIYGVSSLLENKALVSNERFESFVRGLNTEQSIASVMDVFLDRLRPGPFKDPVLEEGDLALAIVLLAIAEARNPGDPDQAYRVSYSLIYGLPVKSELPSNVPDLPAFEAKLRAMKSRGKDDGEYWAIDNWLEP